MGFAKTSPAVELRSGSVAWFALAASRAVPSQAAAWTAGFAEGAEPIAVDSIVLAAAAVAVSAVLPATASAAASASAGFVAAAASAEFAVAAASAGGAAVVGEGGVSAEVTSTDDAVGAAAASAVVDGVTAVVASEVVAIAAIAAAAAVAVAAASGSNHPSASCPTHYPSNSRCPAALQPGKKIPTKHAAATLNSTHLLLSPGCCIEVETSFKPEIGKSIGRIKTLQSH